MTFLPGCRGSDRGRLAGSGAGSAPARLSRADFGFAGQAQPRLRRRYLRDEACQKGKQSEEETVHPGPYIGSAPRTVQPCRRICHNRTPNEKRRTCPEASAALYFLKP